MNRKFGKKPARGTVVFKFADVFDAAFLPKPPAAFGHWRSIHDFEMLGNDNVGDCIFAGGAHETMIFATEGGKPAPKFSDAGVISDYSAVTGYNPADPQSDQGGDMEDAAKYRRRTGLVDATGFRHKIDAYVALEPGDVQHLLVAMYITGAVGMGFMLPSTAIDQTDAAQPWSVTNNSADIVGGHYVPGVGRKANGNLVCVTWGQPQEITPDFYYNFSDEAIAYISLEILNSKKLSPEGYNEASIAKFLAAIA